MIKDTDSRTMDDLADQALAIITKQPGLRCGGIGDALFQDVTTIRGSAPFARIAGKVMKRLEREGRARYSAKGNFGYGGWFPSKPPEAPCSDATAP